MAKAFASQGDMVAKKISFTEIGRDLYAFTAEGDPNTGVIIGDDSVMVALSRRAGARRVGLWRWTDHRLRKMPRHDSRAWAGRLGLRVRSLSTIVSGF
jgi:hypothetical protein